MNGNASGPDVSAGDRFAVPQDLSDWVDKPVLLQWILEEVDTLDWSNPELVQILQANPAFQPRFYLVLLIYAYALGRFESDDVIETYFGEAGLKRLFPGQDPRTAGIRRFRRDYRGLLRWGLGQVLKRALRFRFEVDDATTLPAGLNRLMVVAATARLDAARHFDRSSEGA